MTSFPDGGLAALPPLDGVPPPQVHRRAGRAWRSRHHPSRKRSRIPRLPVRVLEASLLVAMTLFLSASSTSGPMPCAAGIPAYFYPYPGAADWAAVTQLPEGSLLVVNPANGPGTSIDPNYSAAIAPLTGLPVTLYAYVDTAYGARALDVMVREAQQYREWYGLDAVFLDQTAADGQALAHYRRLADRLRSAGFTAVAMNPGQPDVDPGYFAFAQHVVTYEGPYEQYLHQEFPDPAGGPPREQVWHLVYDVDTDERMTHVLHLAGERGAGVVYATDRLMPNPWDALPWYWEAQQGLLRPC